MTVKTPQKLVSQIFVGLCSVAVVVAIIFCLWQLTHQTPPVTPITYICENGAEFTTQEIEGAQLEITSNGKVINRLRLNPDFNAGKSYSDENVAYTFVTGYEGQVTYTWTSEDGSPRSTFCQIKSEINNTGALDPAEQSRVQSLIKLIDAEKNYKVKTLKNDYFVAHDEVTDNGQELTGYFKDGKIQKLTYSLGVSYGFKNYLYYFDNGKLIFVYEEEKDFPVTDEGLDYTKTETLFSAGYFFQDDKLKMINSSGTPRFSDNKDLGKELLANAEQFVNILSN